MKRTGTCVLERGAGFGQDWLEVFGEGGGEEWLVRPAGDEVAGECAVDCGVEGTAVKAGRGTRILWGKAEDAGMGDAVGLHAGYSVSDEGVPVAHADVDRAADLGGQEFGLAECPAGEWRAFGEGIVAETDFGVAVLQFFDDRRRHGAAGGDPGEVFGHLAEDIGGAVGEEEDGFFHRLVYGIPLLLYAFKVP